MTIREFIEFLKVAADECRTGLNTPIRNIRMTDCNGEKYVNTRRSVFQMEKKANKMLDNFEYLNLIIIEKD